MSVLLTTKDVRYRTQRGGHIPFTLKEQRQILELYNDHTRPVREIAELFSCSIRTIYRVLPLLGVRAQDPA